MHRFFRAPATLLCTLALGGLAAACGEPVRPANPSPLQTADHFHVPVAVLADLQASAARIQPPAQPAAAGLGVSESSVTALWRTLDRMRQRSIAHAPKQP